MLLGEQLEPAVLRVVGVLVLVHEHEAEGPAIALAHLGEELETFTARKSRSSKSIAFELCIRCS